MPFAELDIVRLVVDKPGAPAGTVGCLVHVEHGLEVEAFDEHGDTIDVFSVEPHEIEAAGRRWGETTA